MHRSQRGCAASSAARQTSEVARPRSPPILVPHRLRLEKQADLRPSGTGSPSADRSKTSGYGSRIEGSRRQIQVSPSCGSRNTSNAIPERPARTPTSGAPLPLGFRRSSGPVCGRPAGPRSRTRESAAATPRTTRTGPRSLDPRGRAYENLRRDRSPTRPPRTTGSPHPPYARRCRVGCQESHASMSGCIRSPQDGHAR
jgi:hypothetical protein